MDSSDFQLVGGRVAGLNAPGHQKQEQGKGHVGSVQKGGLAEYPKCCVYQNVVIYLVFKLHSFAMF